MISFFIPAYACSAWKGGRGQIMIITIIIAIIIIIVIINSNT